MNINIILNANNAWNLIPVSSEWVGHHRIVARVLCFVYLHVYAVRQNDRDFTLDLIAEIKTPRLQLHKNVPLMY